MLRKIILTTAASAVAAFTLLPTAASAQAYGYGYPVQQSYYQPGYDDHRGWGDRDRWERERWHREEDRRRYWDHERHERRRWHDGYGY
jgi:hypothetical protein